MKTGQSAEFRVDPTMNGGVVTVGREPRSCPQPGRGH